MEDNITKVQIKMALAQIGAVNDYCAIAVW